MADLDNPNLAQWYGYAVPQPLADRPAPLPDVRPREMREPPLGQSNLAHRALASFGQPSLDSLRRGLEGQETPTQVARTFLETGPVGPFGMIAGRLARTADQAALRRAEEMAGRGASRDEIWNETGWFRGQDGKWRFEIDDSGAAISNSAWAAAGPNAARDPELAPVLAGRARPFEGAPWPETLRHEALYEAYPALRQGNVRLREGARDGYTDLRDAGVTAPNIGEARSVALHERQHDVQGIEGFFGGDNSLGGIMRRDPEYQRVARASGEALNEWLRHSPAEDSLGRIIGDIFFGRRRRAEREAAREQYDSANRAVGPAMDAAYRRAPSEHEALMVEARRNMTPEQRRATPPWRTQDVPDDQMIWWRQRPKSE